MSSKLLIIVDMQNDFVTGSLAIPGAYLLPEKIASKIEEYDGEYLFTMDTHGMDYLTTREGKYLPVSHCIENTPGWCIVVGLFKYTNHSVVRKRGFFVEDWKYHIERVVGSTDIDVIDICGVATDICVISNALVLRGLFPEATIRVISNLCAGTTEHLHNAALEVMRSCQIEII